MDLSSQKGYGATDWIQRRLNMRQNRVICRNALWAMVMTFTAMGCKGTGSTAPASEGGNPETAIVVPGVEKGNQITGPRADFYK